MISAWSGRFFPAVGGQREIDASTCQQVKFSKCVEFKHKVSTSFKDIEVWGPFTSEQTLFGARFLEGLRGGSPCAPVATPDLKYVAGWCFRLFRLSYGALGRYSGELSRPKGRGDRSESD